MLYTERKGCAKVELFHVYGACWVCVCVAAVPRTMRFSVSYIVDVDGVALFYPFLYGLCAHRVM